METCIMTENTDNTVIILSAQCIVTIFRWEDKFGPFSMNAELNEQLSTDLRDIISN